MSKQVTKQTTKKTKPSSAKTKAAGALPAKITKPKPATKQPPSLPVYHAAPLIECEADVVLATEALLRLDPEPIGRMLALAGPVPLRRREPGFAGLVSIIVAQQVSVASANAIEARLQAGLVPFAPETVLAASDEALRLCGLSSPKMRSLRALSEALVAGVLNLSELGAMSPEAAHTELVIVKGIGPWTADIFLMFCLGHSDAFAQGDLALQEAAKLAFELESRPDAAALHGLAEKWRPFRGVAARLLWAYYKARKDRAGIGV